MGRRERTHMSGTKTGAETEEHGRDRIAVHEHMGGFSLVTVPASSNLDLRHPHPQDGGSGVLLSWPGVLRV